MKRVKEKALPASVRKIMEMQSSHQPLISGTGEYFYQNSAGNVAECRSTGEKVSIIFSYLGSVSAEH